MKRPQLQIGTALLRMVFISPPYPLVEARSGVEPLTARFAGVSQIPPGKVRASMKMELVHGPTGADTTPVVIVITTTGVELALPVAVSTPPSPIASRGDHAGFLLIAVQ